MSAPQANLLALLYGGLTFAYSRWRNAALTQTAFLALAAAHAQRRDPCGAAQARLASMAGLSDVRRAASLLSSAHHCLLLSLGDGGGRVDMLPQQGSLCRVMVLWVQVSPKVCGGGAGATL